jgi:hypothetical protein
VSFRLHVESRLALLQGEGTLSPKGWEETTREIVAGASTGQIGRILSDRRVMASSEQPGMEHRLLKLVEEYAEALGRIQWAILVPEAALPVTRRLAGRLCEQGNVRIGAFGELGEAIKWLLGVYEGPQVTMLMAWVNETA